MTEYFKIELKSAFRELDKVTVTVVPNDAENESEAAYELTFDCYDEAKNQIEILENTNQIYF